MTAATPRMTRREARLTARGREIVTSGDLRRVRDALGMSRPQMAALLGISPATLVEWELNGRVPGPERLLRIGEVVGEMRTAIDKEAAAT